MPKSVKIIQLFAPPDDLSQFDPGEFFSKLEFQETEADITEEDRNGIAQLAHFMAFLALESRSSKWDQSVVAKDSQAMAVLETHFGEIPGWPKTTKRGLSFRKLASFLMPLYPPKDPE
jgi:hypothetical protein